MTLLWHTWQKVTAVVDLNMCEQPTVCWHLSITRQRQAPQILVSACALSTKSSVPAALMVNCQDDGAIGCNDCMSMCGCSTTSPTHLVVCASV